MVARYGVLDVLISRRLFGNWLTILMLAKTALKSVVLIHIHKTNIYVKTHAHGRLHGTIRPRRRAASGRKPLSWQPFLRTPDLPLLGAFLR